ncbi:MAG: DUF2147 domain-containing protein [Croceibacterium sp.]
MRLWRIIMRGFIPPLALAVAAPAMAGPSIEGLWLNDDHKGLVRIAPCGAKLCGIIAKVLDTDPRAPKTDIHNADPKLRNRPILGVAVLTGFERHGDMWRNGRAYDPEGGKSYKSTLQLNPDGSLRVTGCVFFICESRRWTRAR